MLTLFLIFRGLKGRFYLYKLPSKLIYLKGRIECRLSYQNWLVIYRDSMGVSEAPCHKLSRLEPSWNTVSVTIMNNPLRAIYNFDFHVLTPAMKLSNGQCACKVTGQLSAKFVI